MIRTRIYLIRIEIVISKRMLQEKNPFKLCKKMDGI